MKPEELKQYSATDDMLKNDLGVGLVTVYQLKNHMAYLIVGEYHNKGALSPTVGARCNKGQSFYDILKDAFHRKRLGKIDFDDSEISEKNIFYSINEKQKLARLTFVQQVELELTDEEFKKKYIIPMHNEAQRQGSVSEFFWKLDETINPNRVESKCKFKFTEDRVNAAKKAQENITGADFQVDSKIIKKLIAMQDEKNTWDEDTLPLDFYGNNGGRKYSEFTSFYLISVADILKQLKKPQIKSGKTDQDKSTVFIEHSCLPQEKWKKFFIFEDEIKTFAEIMDQLIPAKSDSNSIFKSISKTLAELDNPWKVERINCEKFKVLDNYKKLAINN